MTVATTPRVGVTFGEVTAGASGWVCSKSGDERPHHHSWYWRCWRSPNPPSSYLRPKLPRSQFLVFSSPKKWQPETRWRLRTRGLTRTGSSHWNYASELNWNNWIKHNPQRTYGNGSPQKQPPHNPHYTEMKKRSWSQKLLYFLKKRWNLVHALLFWGILNWVWFCLAQICCSWRCIRRMSVFY